MSIKLVDGVQSNQTYAVLATHGEHRLALRWLNFDAINNTVSACFKIHIEKNSDEREVINQRSFSKFGLPSEFLFKQNRFTGVIEIPFSYLPSIPTKITVEFEMANIPQLLWEVLLQKLPELGGEICIDKQDFATWLFQEMNNEYLKYAKNRVKASEGYPDPKVVWRNLSPSDYFVGGENADDDEKDE